MRPAWGPFMSSQDDDRSRVPRRFLARCRLCWRITAAVFLAILLIEAVILVPSYRNYERDRIGEFSRAASSAVEAAFRVAGRSDSADLPATSIIEALIGVAGLRGIAIVDRNGNHRSGAGVTISANAVETLLSGRADRVQDGRDSVVVQRPLPTDMTLRVMLDIATPELAGALRGFLLRIAGLVALIAAVVTVATMLVLRATVLSPLLRLEQSVAAAAEDPHHADRFCHAVERRDELGSLFGNVNWLLRSVSSTLAVIGQRERELSELNATLEDRVQNRTRELEIAKRVAEAASQAKSMFLANMSHELRTPLNAIIGFAEIMDGGLFGRVSEPRYRTYICDILGSGRHLLGVIDDVLDISRIEAGEMQLSEGEVDLGEIIADALRLTEMRAQARGVTLIDGSPGRHEIVCGDARLLRQAMLNLMANAINFTLPGGQVEIALVGEDNGAVGIRVADTGIGIDAADLPRVLKPFGQVADVMARAHQGTGLGLPLTNHFLLMHDGRLEIDSVAGQGTTVTAWLPVSRRLGRDEPSRSYGT